MIILIRHAQSEGNKNREIHQMIPDHRVKLTAEGQQQVKCNGCSCGRASPDTYARQKKPDGASVPC